MCFCVAHTLGTDWAWPPDRRFSLGGAGAGVQEKGDRGSSRGQSTAKPQNESPDNQWFLRMVQEHEEFEVETDRAGHRSPRSIYKAKTL